MGNKNLKPETIKLKADYDKIAPDGSEIRLLPKMNRGSLCHCTLPVGRTSFAVKHKTIEEIWYILDGNGQIWRKNGDEETITDLKEGVSITIPTGTRFQFKNVGESPLKIIITTMPPWPGDDEAIRVEGHWNV
jgi:mannose-6-phosphate isomerase-like protein (cupin superfamily)